MKRLISTILFCAVATSSSALVAQERSFTEVLAAIDTVPTREALDAAYPDAVQRLMDASRDASLGIYARHRAITLLSLYPTQETRAFLETLSVEARDPEIRKMAVYTVGRAFGTPGDAALVAFVERATQDETPTVREWAVRSLRWIAHPAAESLLLKLARVDHPMLQAIAKRALRKRAPSAQ